MRKKANKINICLLFIDFKTEEIKMKMTTFCQVSNAGHEESKHTKGLI
jgi:hypothetical protein